MWKTLKIVGAVLGTFALMLACGFAALGGAVTFLMRLGSKLHHGEGAGEYYFVAHQYVTPVFICGIAALGFLAPGGIVWYLYKHSWRVSLRMLLVAVTVVAVILAIYFYTAY
jgi:hypothetical protein